MFESPKQIEQKGPSSMVALVVLALALVGGTAGWFLYQRSADAPAEQPELPCHRVEDEDGRSADVTYKHTTGRINGNALWTL